MSEPIKVTEQVYGAPTFVEREYTLEQLREIFPVGDGSTVDALLTRIASVESALSSSEARAVAAEAELVMRDGVTAAVVADKLAAEALVRQSHQIATQLREWFERSERENEQHRARIATLSAEVSRLTVERDEHAELMEFYNAATSRGLVAAMAHHIEKLQAKLPQLRDDQRRTPREG